MDMDLFGFVNFEIINVRNYMLICSKRAGFQKFQDLFQYNVDNNVESIYDKP